MNNRFTFKDAILMLLLVVIIVMLGLKMLQDDRQWKRMRKIEAATSEQTRELAAISRLLRGGGAANIPAQGNGTDSLRDDSYQELFARVLDAMGDDQFATGDWMVDAFGAQIHTLTPLVSSDAYASTVQELVIESLGGIDPATLEVQPILAEGWQVEDNSAAYRAFVAEVSPGLTEQAEADPTVYQSQLDALLAQAGEEVPESGALYEAMTQRARDTWVQDQIDEHPERPVPLVFRFTLRRGLVFSDGEPLTAHDFAFAFEWAMNEKVAAPRTRAYYRMIDSVEAEDELHLVVRFKRPYFEALNLAVSLPALPEHYYGKYAGDYETFNQSKGLLLGSGPFRLPDAEGWTPSDRVTLVRNDRYWGVPAPLERVVFRVYTSDVARLTAFRNQETDVFGAQPEQYEEMLDDEALAERANHYEYMTPFNGYRYIAWNQRDRNGDPTPFADKRVRQAMTMLLDRQQMIDEIMLGYAELSTGPFNPLGDQGSPRVEPWPYDPDAAKRLLADAGFEDRDGDRVIEGPDGEPFRFKLTYPGGNANYRKMVFFIRDAFAQAGVVLEPDPLEWSVLVERLDKKDFQAITLGWSSGPETDIYQMFHSDMVLPGGDNFINYRSAELDRLIDKARQTVDEDERLPIWHEAHEVMHEDQPYTFLFWGKSLRFLDDRFQNVQLLKGGLNPRSEWYVPAGAQRWTP